MEWMPGFNSQINCGLTFVTQLEQSTVDGLGDIEVGNCCGTNDLHPF